MKYRGEGINQVKKLGEEELFGPFFHPSVPNRFSLFACLFVFPFFLFRCFLFCFLVCLIIPIATVVWVLQYLSDRVYFFFFHFGTIFFSRALLLVFGFVKIKIVGSPESEPTIFVTNHQSLLDVLVLLFALGPVSFVAKDEIRKVPLLSLFAKKFYNCLFVKQGNSPGQKREETTNSLRRNESSSCSEKILSRIAELKGRKSPKNSRKKKRVLPLVIFPEGTTSNGFYLIQFFSGAFRGPPVQPICIDYKWKSVSPSWESIPTPIYFWQLLTQFSIETTVTFLPLSIPTENEKAFPHIFSTNVREKMASCLKIPLCESSLDQKRSFHQMIRSGAFTWDHVAKVYHGILNPAPKTQNHLD